MRQRNIHLQRKWHRLVLDAVLHMKFIQLLKLNDEVISQLRFVFFTNRNVASLKPAEKMQEWE
jgi:hypothetical protein